MAKVDSIQYEKKALETLPPGQERVDALNRLAAQCVNDPARLSFAGGIAQEALGLARTIEYTVGQARALLSLSKIAASSFDYAHAEELCAEALRIFESCNDALGTADAWSAGVFIAIRTQRIHDAVDFGMRALGMYAEMDVKISLSVVYANMCYAYRLLGDFSAMMRYAFLALENARLTGDEQKLCFALNTLGNAYGEMCDYEQALPYFIEGLEIAERIENDELSAGILNNLATIYMNIGNNTAAIEYSMRALNRAAQCRSVIIQANACRTLGATYMRLQNAALSLQYYRKSLVLYKTMNNHIEEARALGLLGEICAKIGEKKQAEEYFAENLRISQSISSPECEAEALHYIAEFSYAPAGEIPKAVHALRKAWNLIASQSRTMFHERIARLLAAYLADSEPKTAEFFLGEAESIAHSLFDEARRQREMSALAAFELSKIRKSFGRSHDAHSPNDFHIRENFNARVSGFTAKDSRRASDSHEKIGIKVRTFGRFAVSIGEREITNEDWRRKKTRDVFKILLIRHGKPVNVETLLQLLWNDTSPKNCKAMLWNAISTVRKALEPNLKPHQFSSFITSDGNSYTLHLGKNADIDLVQFRQILAKAKKSTIPSEQISLLEQAVQLYTGDFLKEDILEVWAESERQALQYSYMESLVKLCRYFLEQNQDEKAALYAQKALAADATFEEAYEVLLQLFVRKKSADDIRRLYHQCRETFRKELHAAPPKHLERLFATALGK